MHLKIKTPVAGNYRNVFAGFDDSLLMKLTPPGMKMNLLHSDPPDMPGGRIRLRVTIFGIIRQDWENEFSGYELKADECHFVDTGIKMPFPMKYWRHDHRVLRDGDHTLIFDDIEYKCGFFLIEWLLYPILWAQFRYRRPIYRRHFGTR